MTVASMLLRVSCTVCVDVLLVVYEFDLWSCSMYSSRNTQLDVF